MKSSGQKLKKGDAGWTLKKSSHL